MPAVPLVPALASTDRAEVNYTTTTDEWPSPTRGHLAHSPPLIPSRAPSPGQQQSLIATSMVSTWNRNLDEEHDTELEGIVDETLRVLREGFYTFKGVDQLLTENIAYSKEKTRYYPPSSRSEEHTSELQSP